ncbi:uncharacterized protein LOC128605360 [Ictalurus furcatus]|uniref:uncharacterized protein LOC128605360 n=1 Tax=Ictalurus furcatus TaxID=66913 RepID=UPI00235055DB|nr:uncharacterized protein LOC128605360 [Ictalurus furcatus]
MAEGKKKMSPIERVISKHCTDEKDIRHYCKKWSEKTSGEWKWPEEGTFDEQLCQIMKERLAVWNEQKKGLRLREKYVKTEKIVDWFEEAGKEEKEKDRRQRERAEAVIRKKEEKEASLGKKIKEAVQKEWAEAPPSYNPQYHPPARPVGSAPPAGLYMMQDLEDREDEWKETEVDIQGTFTGYQRMRHRMREDGEPIKMEEGAAEYEDRTPVESESPRLDLPQVGNKERDRELQEYMKDWTHTRWPEHGEIPPSTSTPRPGSLPRVHKQKDKRLGEIQEQEGHGTRGNQEGRRSERGHEGGNRARGAPHTTGGGKSEPRDNVGRVVRIEGDVVLSPYAIEEDKELEGRIQRLEDGISYGVGKMDELKNLAGQAFQMATAVKNKYAHKPRLGESKSQRSRRALNQSAGKHVKSLSKASKVLIYHKQKKKQVSSDMDLDEQVGTESEGTDTDNEGKVEQDISEEEDLEPRGARSLRSRASLKPPVRFEPGITAYLAHARSQSEPSLTQVGGSPPGQMMPLMVKGKALHYAPWNFMDLTGLIQRLPNMCEGGQKWIRNGSEMDCLRKKHQDSTWR